MVMQSTSGALRTWRRLSWCSGSFAETGPCANNGSQLPASRGDLFFQCKFGLVGCFARHACASAKLACSRRRLACPPCPMSRARSNAAPAIALRLTDKAAIAVRLGLAEHGQTPFWPPPWLELDLSPFTFPRECPSLRTTGHKPPSVRPPEKLLARLLDSTSLCMSASLHVPPLASI
jgi:hypothetical protein